MKDVQEEDLDEPVHLGRSQWEASSLRIVLDEVCQVVLGFEQWRRSSSTEGVDQQHQIDVCLSEGLWMLVMSCVVDASHKKSELTFLHLVILSSFLMPTAAHKVCQTSILPRSSHLDGRSTDTQLRSRRFARCCIFDPSSLCGWPVCRIGHSTPRCGRA